MSESAVEQAGGQAAQGAAVALRILIMAAQAIREHQRQEALRKQPNALPVPAPGTERYAQIVAVNLRDDRLTGSLVGAPQWREFADALKGLEATGVDVGRFLRDAAPLIRRIDADVRASRPHPGVQVAPQPPMNPYVQARTAVPSGPRPRDGRGLATRTAAMVRGAGDKVRDLGRRGTNTKLTGDEAARVKALASRGIDPQQNAALVVRAREALADEQLLGHLVFDRAWPATAAQMMQLQAQGHDPRVALAQVPARIDQAAAAGIGLGAGEAARGLMSDQAATPVPSTPAASQTRAQGPKVEVEQGATATVGVAAESARVSAAAAQTTGKVVPVTFQEPASASARTAAATAQSTTAGAAPTPTAPTHQAAPTTAAHVAPTPGQQRLR